MKTSEHIFSLTKNEQRVVILVVLALLAGAVVNHYRQTWSHRSRAVRVQVGSTPVATPRAEEERVADE